MYRPSQVIGSISAVLSLGALLSSVFFLTYTFRIKCDIRAFDVEYLSGTGLTSIDGDNGFTFKRPVLLSEIHGKCRPKKDMGHSNIPLPESPINETGVEHGSGLNSNATEPDPNSLNPENVIAEKEHPLELGNSTSGPSLSSSEYNAEECSIICTIPKFKDCAGIGIGTGCLQFVLAFFYIFWKKKTIPVMSIFFWTHLAVFLFDLTVLTVVVHAGAGSHVYTKEFYNGAFQAGFCAVIGLNCCFLLGTLFFLCLTCDIKDYHDHCGDKNGVSERTLISTAMSMRTADKFSN